MKNCTVILALSTLLLSSCESSQKMSSIVFKEAKNYFVRNDAPELENPKIETAEQFDKIFGMATTMGNEGKPTEIDFQKQYVIAVILPETPSMTTIRPVSLEKNDKGVITFTYETTVGQKQSYTIRPSLAIIVDKSENGSVQLREKK